MRGDFRLGEWLVRPSVNRIEGPRGTIGVTPRAMAVLVRLADERGEVVTKRQLLDDIWGEAVVTEDALTQAIVELRKAFGDRALNARVIETIRRVGFRLLPPVRTTGVPLPALPIARPGAGPLRHDARIWMAIVGLGFLAVAFTMFGGDPGPPRRPVNSVAVMPFANLNDDPELEYFSDGLSEEILNRIADLPDLRVPARTSAFSFKGRDMDVREIGRRLGVDSVLEGSVQRFQGRVRVTAQLVDADDGLHIWSDTYDRPLTDIFSIQEDIARSIAGALKLKLSSEQLARLKKPPPARLDAYDYYMLGEFHFRQRQSPGTPGAWLERARGYYRNALELDPDFAAAYVGIAKTYLPLLWSVRADTFDDSMAQAQQAIDTALRLDPDSADAYTVLAWIRNNRFDHAGVAQAARKALEINPNNVEAMFRLAQAEENQGHFAPALDLYRRQLELDPLNPDSVQSIADRLAALGQRDEAIANLQRVFGDNIDDAWPLVPIAIEYGRYDEAVRIAGQRTDELFRAAQLARAWAILGDRELAEAWFERAQASHSFGYVVPIPDVFIRLGRVDELVAFTRQTMEAQAMPRDGPLSPAQFQLLTVAAVAQTLAGNFGEAIRYWEWRLEYEQVRLLGNPDEHISALTFLAYAYREIGDQSRSRSLLSTALEVADSAREQGIADYPPLTIAVARLHAQLGESDAALDALDQAIAEGWRDYYGESALPMWQSLRPDAGYQDRLARVRADLESMSEEARRNGWAVFPEATGRIRPSLQRPPPGARLPARIAADRT